MGVLFGEARKHQYPTSVGLANATGPQGDLVHIYTGHTTSVAEIAFIYTPSLENSLTGMQLQRRLHARCTGLVKRIVGYQV